MFNKFLNLDEEENVLNLPLDFSILILMFVGCYFMPTSNLQD